MSIYSPNFSNSMKRGCSASVQYHHRRRRRNSDIAMDTLCRLEEQNKPIAPIGIVTACARSKIM